jgi:hypothetical protein
VNLGVLFAEGKGVLQDYVEARKWFNLAAAVGDPGCRPEVTGDYKFDGPGSGRRSSKDGA